MKNIRFLTFILVIGTLVLSACGAAAATAAPNVGAGRVEALPVAFVGIVDSIAGDQWVISGTTVTVDPAVVRDGPFAVGDQVKVEGIVNTDGSFTVSRVEAPTPQDISTLPELGNDNTNEANTNDANINDANVNDDNSNGAGFDDNGNGANTNDDNGGATNANDDNGGNTNDDNGGGSNSNDDSGGGGGNSGSGKGSGGGGNDNGGGGGGNDNGGGGGGNSNDD